MPRHTYEITTSDGKVYQIEADSDEQANHISQVIQREVDNGNPDLKGTDFSMPVDVRQGQQFPGVDYNADGQVNRTGPDLSAAIGGLGGALVDGSADAFVRGAANGITFNFMDELAAAANTVLPLGQSAGTGWAKGFSKAYDDNLALQRQIDAADASQHPTAKGFGQAAGAVLQALLGGKALKAVAPAILPKSAIGPMAAFESAQLAAPVRTSAALATAGGALSGAAAGFGAGEDLSSRTKSAAMGGTLGAMTGAVAGPAATAIGPAVARYAGVLFGRGADAEATRQLVQALQRDGYDVTSPSGVLSLKNELSSYLGKPVSLADIGAATRARAGVGLRSPSKAQDKAVDAVLSRQRGQVGRLESDIFNNVAPRADVHAVNEALVNARDEAALPLREKALFTEGPGFGSPGVPDQPLALPTGGVENEPLDAGLRRMLGQNVPEATPTYVPAPRAATEVAPIRQARIPEDPQLQQLARLPLAQRALDAAKGIAQAEVSLRSVLGQDISHLPDVIKPGADLDMRTLDYLKRFLDTEVTTLARRGKSDTFGAAEYGQVKALRDALRERMRVAVPDYGDYLDAYRGSSDMIDALEAGRGYRNMDPEQIAAAQADSSKAEQELYRVGVARDLIDQIKDTRGTGVAANRILETPNAIEKLAATGVPADNMARLSRSVDLEREMSRLTGELTGSATDARRIAAQDAEAGVSAALPFNPGSPVGWLGAGARAVLNRASTARNAAVNESLLPRILETDPAAIDRIVENLVASGRKQEAAELIRAANTYKSMSVLGNMLGTASANTEGK